jgi:archaeal flagellin FlaB
MFNKKAEAGIGTLILFIALILVAAVAAGVLIQTSGSLQSRALSTGSKAETQVSTQVVFNVVWGQDGSNGNVEELYAELKLAPGSDGIKLNDTLVEIILSNQSQNLANYGTVTTCDTTTVQTTVNDNTKFATQYVLQGPSYKADYLQSGDTVLICFETPRLLTENEDISLIIIPKTGGLTQVAGSTPDVMTTFKVDFFP